VAVSAAAEAANPVAGCRAVSGPGGEGGAPPVGAPEGTNNDPAATRGDPTTAQREALAHQSGRDGLPGARVAAYLSVFAAPEAAAKGIAIEAGRPAPIRSRRRPDVRPAARALQGRRQRQAVREECEGRIRKEHPIGTLAPLALLAAVAGFCQGLTGFGFALVFVPLAALLLPARDVVFTSVLVGGLVGAIVAVETFRVMPWRRAASLVVGAMLAAPFGVATLVVLDVATLRVVLSFTALAMAAAFLIVRPREVGREREGPMLFVVGVVGGFLNGCTSMGGPPVGLAVANQHWNVAQTRAALAVFNIASYIVGLSVAAVARVVHPGSLHAVPVVAPVAILGGFAGSFAARHLSPGAFRRALVALVAGTAVLALVLGFIRARLGP